MRYLLSQAAKGTSFIVVLALLALIAMSFADLSMVLVCIAIMFMSIALEFQTGKLPKRLEMLMFGASGGLFGLAAYAPPGFPNQGFGFWATLAMALVCLLFVIAAGFSKPGTNVEASAPNSA